MNCATHPEEPITGACERCGGFVCKLDARALEGKTFCAECAERPDVDYLEAFKQQFWGKRDGFAWFFGLGGTLVSLYVLLWRSDPIFAGLFGLPSSQELAPAAVLFVYATLSLAIDVNYLKGQSWARKLAFLPTNVALSSAFELMGFGGERSPDAVGDLAFNLVVPWLLALAAYFSTRNKLFFKIEVSDRALKNLWEKERNNPSARIGFLGSFVGFVLPGTSIAMLALSLHGLRCVNPTALPPIGRRGQAIAGIALSLLGLVWWALIAALATR